MTDDQKRAAVTAEITRARDAFKSAELLLGAGMYADAVSRAYYAAYHVACALLLTVGEEPRTHAGVHRLIQREFVRTQKISAEQGLLLSRLMTFRLDADYSAEYVFTEATARGEIDAARTFMQAGLGILAAEGWIA